MMWRLLKTMVIRVSGLWLCGNGCWISWGKPDNTVESLDPLTTDDDDLFNFLRFSEMFNPCLGDLIALFFSHNPFQMMIFSFDFN